MNLMEVDRNSEFSKSLFNLFKIIKPTKLIETGTYIGTGSTAIISSILKELNIPNFKFYSIEVNPHYVQIAINNLKRLKLLEYVEIFNGLSIRTDQLPTKNQIDKKFVKKVWPSDIYIDYNADNRVDRYFKETNFLGLHDNLLVKCLELFDYKPDFVLLDSGGHIGQIEFQNLINNLKGPCVIALDDIYHVKHWDSLNQIYGDNRFEIQTISKEKFGFCITYFYPGKDNEKV